jgi:hypothetical protein
VLAVLACSVGAPAPTATPVPTNTPVPSNTPVPTATTVPTDTPEPTATPNVAATQKAEAFQSLLATIKDKGYIETTDGETRTLDDFKEEWAKINYYNWWWPVKEEYSDFVFKAHIKWSTAGTTPDISGCGIGFGIQENGDHYAVILDKARLVFLMGRGSRSYEVGVTRGSGRMNFDNPAEADFVVVVKGQRAFVSVDGTFVEYTLSADQTSSGLFAYTLLSGTNKDYGTRCEMTDVQLWLPK